MYEERRMGGEYKPRSCVTKSSIFPLRIFMKLLASNILQESVRVTEKLYEEPEEKNGEKK